MLRVALGTLALAAVAGCGGSGGEPARIAAGTGVSGELRSPDARTPLMRAEGVWRCETAGTVELLVSTDGFASLIRGGRVLAVVGPRRSFINRACTARSRAALPVARPRRGLAGASRVRCRVPRFVLVDLRGGDLAVRDAGRGRAFRAGAAVSPRHLEPTGYWSAGCALTPAP